MVYETADPLLMRPPFPADRAFGGSIELAAYLMEIDPVTICLGPFQFTGKVGRGHRPVLIPIGEVIRKLEFVTQAAKSLNVCLSVFACTEARAAVALNSDTDLRDRKFLTGSKTSEGLHAYCGGPDAAISRALAFARYADVVCFKSSNADLAEANHFASEIKGAFPGKGLGFGHAPRPDDQGLE
jgi:isocitrate lyase